MALQESSLPMVSETNRRPPSPLFGLLTSRRTRTAASLSAENVPCYIELADANQEVQPGSSIGILEGFRLVDEENPVTLEFTGGFDKSGQKFTHEFTLQ